MDEVTKIMHGRVYRPRAFVEQALAEMVEAVGGRDEFAKILEQYTSVPERALDIAFRHARIEGILTGVGETLVVLAVHAGVVGCILQFGPDAAGYPWVQAFLPAILALALHLFLQVYWTTTWCNTILRPAFAGRTATDALREAKAFYNHLIRRLVLYIWLFYPVGASLTLLWIEAPDWAWYVELPAALLTGWMSTQLYSMRLLHTDIRPWFKVFALELSADDAALLGNARKGRGLHRRLWDWLEPRSREMISPFEIFAITQCAFGIIAGIVVLTELALLDRMDAKLGVVVPLALGLLAVAYSYFRRFAFLSQAGKEASVPPRSKRSLSTAGPDDNAAETSARMLDETSRVLRRAMP